MGIIGGLAAAVMAQAGYIVKLNVKVSALYDDQIQALERQLAKLNEQRASNE